MVLQIEKGLAQRLIPFKTERERIIDRGFRLHIHLFLFVATHVRSVIATAGAESELAVPDVINVPFTLPTLPRLYHLREHHWLAATLLITQLDYFPAASPIPIELEPPLTDVFPIRGVIQAHAVLTLLVSMLLF